MRQPILHHAVFANKCAAALAPNAHKIDSFRMVNLSRPSDPNVSGYGRIMFVYGAVAESGPVKLEDVVRITGLSRSACWRCLTTLEDQGWLSRGLSDATFKLSSHAHRAQNGAQHASDLSDRLLASLRDISKMGRIQIDLAQFRGPADLGILETNRPDHCDACSLSFFEDPLVLAALVTVPVDGRMAHMRAALEGADTEIKERVSNGEFTNRLATVAADGEIWDASQQFLCLPLVGGALRLEGMGSTARTERRLRDIGLKLRADFPDLLPSGDEIRQKYWRRVEPRPAGEPI